MCKGNDRYVVLEIEGGGIYEGGKYDVEVFFGKGESEGGGKRRAASCC